MKKVVKSWQDFQLLDFGDGVKFEKWNNIVVGRPDPLAKGDLINFNDSLQKSHIYYNDKTGKGKWQYRKKIKDSWQVNYKDLTFKVSPTSHKHMGLFPEQAVNWDYIREKIEETDKEVNVLNLFAYTGAATINAAKAGANKVVHVDALKQVNDWAQENSKLSNTEEKKIHYFCDDVITFLKREVKRGNTYQIIIMDPPSFGRGPKNKVWDFDKNIDELMSLTKQLLKDPICLMMSVYKSDFNQQHLLNLMSKYYPKNKLETYELFLPSSSEKILPAGITGIYSI